MNDQQGLLNERRETTHERITQPSKVCAIPHLFGENVSRVDPSRDVEDVHVQDFVLYPFPYRVLLQLHVPNFL